ncbi:MAG: hypothetical protein WC657_06625 [Candidatus Paceibacterota bacterium]|jgi:hypothetical protein
MMAWKTTFQMASMKPIRDGFSFSDGDRKGVVVSGFRGDNVRVTVEEIVSECCEKWRGKHVATRELDSTSIRIRYLVGEECCPTFCPECGRKL